MREVCNIDGPINLPEPVYCVIPLQQLIEYMGLLDKFMFGLNATQVPVYAYWPLVKIDRGSVFYR